MNISENFNLKTSFDDLGFDSFDKINFLTSVESEFKTLFDDNVFDNFRCPEDVIKYLSITTDAM